jgi:hypothetical protein
LIGHSPVSLRPNRVFRDAHKLVKSQVTKVEIIGRIKSDPHFGKMKLLEVGDGISLTSKMSFKSWGESITIIPVEKNDGILEFSVTSKPKLSTTLFDYGKNLEIVNRLASLIGHVSG